MILENKLGLTSSADLARAEERISKKKAAELFDCKLFDSFPAGKFETLQAIHNSIEGSWNDLQFDKAMKKFRKSFKQEIELIENRYHLSFHKNIPNEF